MHHYVYVYDHILGHVLFYCACVLYVNPVYIIVMCMLNDQFLSILVKRAVPS